LSKELYRPPSWVSALMRRGSGRAILVISFLVAAIVALAVAIERGDRAISSGTDVSSQSRRLQGHFTPSEAQWASLMVESVQAYIFRAEHVTEGKIAVNEDRATPIFSPYSGRVTKLLAKPGDTVEYGQPLFYIEAADMVQAQNDFLSAVAAGNKARSRLTLAEIVERQNRTLHENKAVPLRDWQQSQADLGQAQSDLHTAESALEAARNRLRILGKTDDEIAAFKDKGTISPETPIYAPIAGTVVQRKIGPGQYVSYTSTGSTDPVFLIGDLSTVWLVAYVRESEAPRIKLGQPLTFTVLAFPDELYKGNINYVSAVLDANLRRLMVRATIDNTSRALKPEMFASVAISTDEGDRWPAIARDAVIYDGENARVWIVHDDKSVEPRPIKTGVTSGRYIQILDGLTIGEKVVTKGALFVDRAAAAS
jgi:membrane fusion protein, heavy metal efflux system